MRVDQLIEKLKEFPPEARVTINNRGDVFTLEPNDSLEFHDSNSSEFAEGAVFVTIGGTSPEVSAVLDAISKLPPNHRQEALKRLRISATDAAALQTAIQTRLDTIMEEVNELKESLANPPSLK